MRGHDGDDAAASMSTACAASAPAGSIGTTHAASIRRSQVCMVEA
jgi:hypothetical protein